MNIKITLQNCKRREENLYPLETGITKKHVVICSGPSNISCEATHPKEMFPLILSTYSDMQSHASVLPVAQGSKTLLLCAYFLEATIKIYGYANTRVTLTHT